MTLFIQTAGDSNSFRGQDQNDSSYDGAMRKRDKSLFSDHAEQQLYPEYKATQERSADMYHMDRKYMFTEIKLVLNTSTEGGQHWEFSAVGCFY